MNTDSLERMAPELIARALQLLHQHPDPIKDRVRIVEVAMDAERIIEEELINAVCRRGDFPEARAAFIKLLALALKGYELSVFWEAEKAKG